MGQSEVRKTLDILKRVRQRSEELARKAKTAKISSQGEVYIDKLTKRALLFINLPARIKKLSPPLTESHENLIRLNLDDLAIMAREGIERKSPFILETFPSLRGESEAAGLSRLDAIISDIESQLPKRR